MDHTSHLDYFEMLDDYFRYRREIKPPEAAGIERIAIEYRQEYSWFDRFDHFINSDRPTTTQAIIVGIWDLEGWNTDGGMIAQTLVAAKDRLPALRALFVGDITSDEAEISWIQQGDLSPLLLAFPNLEHLCIRGGSGLDFGGQHANLRTLVIQAGGLSGMLVRNVCQSRFPRLEHLELWLGTEHYGATNTINDLAPLLQEDCFPNLRYLGLRNSDLSDAIAQALVGSPVLNHIKVLDLSLGVLSDAGATALLQEPAIKQLEFLDLHHHYLSTTMIQHIQALGIPVNIDEPQEADQDDDEQFRYVAVGE